MVKAVKHTNRRPPCMRAALKMEETVIAIGVSTALIVLVSLLFLGCRLVYYFIGTSGIWWSFQSPVR
jgi:hypothetical protein